MSSLAAPRPPCAAKHTPIRHGTYRLTLTINGRPYNLRRGKPVSLRTKMWVLSHTADSPRAGISHVVQAYRGTVSCSCEDNSIRGAECKHVRVLMAAGILSRRLKTEPALALAQKGGA